MAMPESTRSRRFGILSSRSSFHENIDDMILMVGLNIRVCKKIQKNRHGIEIRLGENVFNHQFVCVKLEPIETRHAKLYREYNLYKTIGQTEGFCNVIYYGHCGKYRAICLELLQHNLNTLFKLCNRRFTLKTVIMIAVQLLFRLETVHNKTFIFRDVKPENFYIGINRADDRHKLIYIANFELAKEYVTAETQKHIPFRTNVPKTGSDKFMSINTHLKREQSRRDDLEALGYMLVYFLRGSLPWQSICKNTRRLKQRLPLHQLCKGCPEEMIKYLHYVRQLGFDTKPDYKYLRSLFRNVFVSKGLVDDAVFDWTNRLPRCEFYSPPTPPRVMNPRASQQSVLPSTSGWFAFSRRSTAASMYSRPSQASVPLVFRSQLFFEEDEKQPNWCSNLFKHRTTLTRSYRNNSIYKSQIYLPTTIEIASSRQSKACRNCFNCRKTRNQT